MLSSYSTLILSSAYGTGRGGSWAYLFARISYMAGLSVLLFRGRVGTLRDAAIQACAAMRGPLLLPQHTCVVLLTRAQRMSAILQLSRFGASIASL